MAKKTKVKTIKTGVERGNKVGRAKTEKLDKRKAGDVPKIPAAKVGRAIKKAGRAIKGASRAKGGERSTRKLINVNPAKRFRQFLKNYDEAIARGDLKPIKGIEDLRKRFAWNKDGSPDLRQLRTNKKRSEFNEAIRDFNRTYRRWGKKAVAEMGEEQREKTRRRIEKGGETFRENEEAHRKKIEKEYGYDFKGAAQSVLDIYQRTADLFGSDAYSKLAEQFNLGSDVPAILADMLPNATAEDIDNYINDFLNGADNLPKEARKLASEDEMKKALFQLTEIHGTGNVSDVLKFYLQADSDEKKRLLRMASYHSENKDKTNKSFAQFYEDFSNDKHIDNDYEKTWGEYL